MSNRIIVNSGINEILGTDRFDDFYLNTSKEYKEYRRQWSENPKNFVLAAFPLHVDIESTNACNLHCIMCSRNFMTEKVGCMDFGLFKKVIDEGAKYSLPSVKFNFRGEPLIHPQLPEMVKYAKDKGILDVQFNTNGLLFDEKKAEAFIKGGLDRIIFSLDGATKKTYERIRTGSNYDVVVHNIKRLIEMRDNMGLKKPFVRVQMVKMKENEHEVEQFVKQWIDVANRVVLIIKRDPSENVENTSCLEKMKKIQQFPCYQLWQRIVVLWNGDVVMCCGDWHNNYVLGNAKEQSIRELWHGAKYTFAREIHKNAEYGKIPICAKCEVNTALVDKDLEKLVERYNNRKK